MHFILGGVSDHKKDRLVMIYPASTVNRVIVALYHGLDEFAGVEHIDWSNIRPDDQDG